MKNQKDLIMYFAGGALAVAAIVALATSSGTLFQGKLEAPGPGGEQAQMGRLADKAPVTAGRTCVTFIPGTQKGTRDEMMQIVPMNGNLMKFTCEGKLKKVKVKMNTMDATVAEFKMTKKLRDGSEVDLVLTDDSARKIKELADRTATKERRTDVVELEFTGDSNNVFAVDEQMESRAKLKAADSDATFGFAVESLVYEEAYFEGGMRKYKGETTQKGNSDTGMGEFLLLETDSL